MEVIQQLLTFLGPIAEQYLGKLPATVLQVLVLIGALRLVVKPLMVALTAFAKETETPKDDEVLAKIETSKAYKLLLFVLDWLASIKIKK